jgi:hypothetical protein
LLSKCQRIQACTKPGWIIKTKNMGSQNNITLIDIRGRIHDPSFSLTYEWAQQGSVCQLQAFSAQCNVKKLAYWAHSEVVKKM